MSDLTTAEMMRALGSLYTERFGDWHLSVSHSLTEPTCPTAVISAEDYEESEPTPVFRVDADTIENAIAGVVYAAYVTLIERQPKPTTVPWTERNEGQTLQTFLNALDEK